MSPYFLYILTSNFYILIWYIHNSDNQSLNPITNSHNKLLTSQYITIIVNNHYLIIQKLFNIFAFYRHVSEVIIIIHPLGANNCICWGSTASNFRTFSHLPRKFPLNSCVSISISLSSHFTKSCQ